ncbi:MAG: cell division protein FtsZ [Rhizomicrobium sp.]
MAINLKLPETKELRPRITVLGVGGAGGNAVNNMIEAGLDGVDFVVANTDAQALAQSKAGTRIQLGAGTTEGLGAGAQPEVGRAGAEESMAEIMEHLSGAHMVFIAAGMGGGTGTGAAPVIARAVREAGILTVGVVTKPFALEGDRRMRVAERGITELQQFVHTLIVIPNQNLFRVASDRTTMSQAFAMADEVLHAGVRGVTDLIVMPGLINLDFADIKSVITEMGKAMMGTGEAEGEDRAIRAADMAISNPLLDDVTMKGAKGVLINITGGPDLMLFEVEQAANRIRAEVDPDANIIFGNTILDEMEGRIRVSVVATGIDAEQMKLPEKVHTLRPHLKPQAFRIEPAKPAINPVQAQVESLAAELNATSAPALKDAHMLGGRDMPAIEEAMPQVAARYPATESYRPLEQQPLAQRPQQPKKAGWSLFGRKKPSADMRAEPLPAERPRATATPMQRPVVQEPVAPPPGEDLFPDHGTDEQFEIPAFLRRQSN